MTCEDSLWLNAVAPDRQTYEAAEGTVAHATAERWLKERDRPDRLVGTIESVRDFDIEITEEMLEFVGDFVSLCESDMEWAEYYASEQAVDISPLTPIPDQGGTADWIAFRWQHMTLRDLKYGKDPVFALGNKQLRVYALGVFFEWDWLYNFQTITLSIVQPRVVNGITEWTITREELLAFAEEAKEAWARSWKPRDQLTRTPSTKGCRWCAAAATCPALYLFLADRDSETFENYDEIDAANAIIDVKPTAVSYERLRQANDIILDDMAPTPFPNMPEPVELSTLALSKLLRYQKLMENFFNRIRAELLNRAISDEEELIWWKVVEARSLRKWVDDENWIVDKIIERFPRVKREHLYVRRLATPAQMERIIHTKAKEEKLTIGKVKAFLSDSGMTVKPVGQKTLAAREDPRKAAPRDSDVFDNYDELEEDI